MTDAERLHEALTKAGDAAGRACRAFIDMIPHLVEAYTVLLPRLIEEYNGLNSTPPRVRHLALHGKKRRTRKKNLHRVQRLNKRRIK